MTCDQAADILDVTESWVKRLAKRGLIRRFERVKGHDYNGQDVQRLRALRSKYGNRDGNRRMALLTSAR